MLLLYIVFKGIKTITSTNSRKVFCGLVVLFLNSPFLYRYFRFYLNDFEASITEIIALLVNIRSQTRKQDC